jgi:hypothetical protein
MRSIISNTRLLCSKKRRVVSLSPSPVSKNHAEQAGIVMMIVTKDLPKKKDLADSHGWCKVADLVGFCKKSAMKRWCKKEECEAAIDDTVESVEAARKVSICLLESYRRKERLLDD